MVNQNLNLIIYILERKLFSEFYEFFVFQHFKIMKKFSKCFNEVHTIALIIMDGTLGEILRRGNQEAPSLHRSASIPTSHLSKAPVYFQSLHASKNTEGAPKNLTDNS